MSTEFGKPEIRISARGVPSYSIELWHRELSKHRLIRGAEASVVRRKADIQAAEWDHRWVQSQIKSGAKQDKESKRQLAAQRSEEAQRELDRLSTLLKDVLDVSEAIDWEQLKDKSEFPEARPSPPPMPQKPSIPKSLREPKRGDAAYAPRLGLLGHILPSRRAEAHQEAEAKFNADLATWRQSNAFREEQHAEAMEQFDAALKANEKMHSEAVHAWEQRKATFDAQQVAATMAVEKQRMDYLAGKPDVVVEYCDMVLSKSQYPDSFPKEFECDYNPETKALIVDYSLPAPDALPRLKEVKYVQSRDELVEHELSQPQASKLYDDVIYQTLLRTVHELFDADTANALDLVTINGWVRSIDRSTGKSINPCILSLQTSKSDFVAIALENVDPRACFKSLKGVGSSKLHGLAPVAPIVQMRREDGRFVAAREVAEGMDPATNLAAMDWEEFEHLIREIFEREFSSNGGEVKVTRASRDGGVDAVVFDPDPIRGGKIVIQAKRYTNTVGVGAVRDLYGTVLNEGANRGILVTTSDYGPDAYEFARGKPLALMNGANLLFLLQKHGQKARIDIQEARLLAGLQARSELEQQ